MKAMLWTYVQTRGIDAIETKDGVTFADANSGGCCEFMLRTDPGRRSLTHPLIVVHAEHSINAHAQAESVNSALVPRTTPATVSEPMTATGRLFAPRLHATKFTSLAEVPEWPNPWPLARRREASVLINEINATRLHIGALSLPSYIYASADELQLNGKSSSGPSALHFDWAIPLSAERDFDLVDFALDVARTSFATYLPALARVVIDGYPWSIALRSAPTRRPTRR